MSRLNASRRDKIRSHSKQGARSLRSEFCCRSSAPGTRCGASFWRKPIWYETSSWTLRSSQDLIRAVQKSVPCGWIVGLAKFVGDGTDVARIDAASSSPTTAKFWVRAPVDVVSQERRACCYCVAVCSIGEIGCCTSQQKEPNDPVRIGVRCRTRSKDI